MGQALYAPLVALASRSIFENGVVKSSKLMKSRQALYCRRERRLPLKAQTPLNPKKSLPKSRIQVLRCYQGSFALFHFFYEHSIYSNSY
jgi:hypothetical protein